MSSSRARIATRSSLVARSAASRAVVVSPKCQLVQHGDTNRPPANRAIGARDYLHGDPALEFDLCSFVNPIFEPQAERYVSYQRFCGGALVHAQQGSLPDASGEKLLRRRWPERHRLYTERA